MLHQDRRQSQSQGNTRPNPPQNSSQSSSKPAAPDKSSSGVKSAGAVHVAQGAESEVVSFMTIPVALSCSGRRVNAVALMDPASSMSFVRQDVAARLGAENVAGHDFSVTVLGGGMVRESR